MNFIDWIKSILNNGRKTPTIYCRGLKKKYNEKGVLEVGLYDNDTPISDADIGIEINTRQYIKKTDENGIARLNINLGTGKYRAIINYPGKKDRYNRVTAYTEVFVTTDTRMEGTDINMTEKDGTTYQCAIYRQDNNERIKETVNITINGKTYTRTADENGLYHLNINLSPGEYTITAEYKGNEIYNPSTITNNINIQPATDKKTIVLGCDSNTDKDSEVQEQIATRLRQEGYPVEKLPIGPNYFASYDYSPNSKGKIGIYLIASGIFSIADAYYGSGQFDNYIFGIRGDFGDKGATCFDCPIRADADCTSICDELDGKTFNQINNMLQPYVAVCGGAQPNELANNIIDWLKAIEQKPQPTPEPTELYPYHTEQGGGQMGQRTGYSCGPHSLMQCIYRLTGIDLSEYTLMEVCGTTSDGTDHEGLETGLAWFNREYGYDLKMTWKNFSEVDFEGTQEAIENGACFHHILYRDTWGHYEVPKWTNGDPIYVLNSLGSDCGNGYCGYIEERSRSEHQRYINGISQKSVCIITR